MVKTTTGSKSVRTPNEASVRGRDVEFPSVPVHVSKYAQTKPSHDVNTFQHFQFRQGDRTTLPHRPSTSGGGATSANFSMRRNAEKRETKDDLHFNPLASHGEGTTFYNFPLPGSLPTPSSSPRSSSPPPRSSSLVRTDTPESIEAQEMNVDDLGIGMAIGSPSHPPPTWKQQSIEQRYVVSASPDPDTMDWAAPTPAKQKASKWKMFGGLFGGGKKQSPVQTQNFYQLQPEGQPGTRTIVDSTHVHWDTPSSQEHRKPARGRTNSERKLSKTEPEVKRSNTAPEDQWSSVRNEGNPEIRLDGGWLGDNVIQKDNSQGGPMLNVDIPSIEMERYSVMFGSLLQKTTNPTPSLLARRQATLDRLKTVNEELASKEREIEEKTRLIKSRRATSPQPTRSPAFSLFPSNPTRLEPRTASPNGRRNQLQRFNTSPAALSPSRPSFAPGLDNDLHATLLEPGPHFPNGYDSEQDHIVSHELEAASHNVLKKKPEPIPSSRTRNRIVVDQEHMLRTFAPDQSHLTLTPDSDIYDPSPLPMKPIIAEPSWQMVKPSHTPASVSGSATSRSDHSTSASASSISTSIMSAPTSASSSAQKSAHTSPKQSSTTTSIPVSTFSSTKSPPQAHATRARSSTTTSQLPRPATARRLEKQLSIASITSATAFNTNPTTASPTVAPKEIDEEHEAHLKSLADVSIARQISVSRQQRQLLIPIKGSVRTNPIQGRARAVTQGDQSGADREKHNQNFPSLLHNLEDLNGVNVALVASPLGAVAMATKEEREKSKARNGSPLGGGAEKRDRKMRERLVEGVKPSTPTLVVVGDPIDNRTWDGNVATVVEPPKLGLAERRRRAREGEREGKSNLAVGTVRGHEYRKSERVVVERVS